MLEAWPSAALIKDADDLIPIDDHGYASAMLIPVQESARLILRRVPLAALMPTEATAPRAMEADFCRALQAVCAVMVCCSP